MADIQYDDRTRYPDQSGPVKQAAGQSAQAASSAASEVAGTAKDQAQNVVTEAKSQVRSVASDVRSRVGSEARTQNDRLAEGIRKFADELEEMVSERSDSPARSVVTQVSQGGRRVADFLAERGPEGALDELQSFARRRPGTFLAVAAAAGFVAGRLGKSAFSAAKDDSNSTPQQFASSAGPTTSSVGIAPVAQPAVFTEPTYAGAGTPVTGVGAPTPVTPVAPVGTTGTTVYGSPAGSTAEEYGSVRP